MARGQRLREERRRLNLTQMQACELAGVREQAWVRYEKGNIFLLDIVEPLDANGFDMVYVIFGQRRSGSSLPPVELEVVSLLNQTALHQRDSLLLLMRTFASAHPKQSGDA